MTDTLEFGPLFRPGERNIAGSGYKSERRSLDFVVNGQSLFKLLRAANRDLVGALGWGQPSWQRVLIDQLLLRAAAPIPGGRQPLFVCAECGDLGCGALTAQVQRAGATVVWRDFKFENNYDPSMTDAASFGDIGPFAFEWTKYQQLLETTLAETPTGQAG